MVIDNCMMMMIKKIRYSFQKICVFQDAMVGIPENYQQH